jgi:hypothetical protein
LRAEHRDAGEVVLVGRDAVAGVALEAARREDGADVVLVGEGRAAAGGSRAVTCAGLRLRVRARGYGGRRRLVRAAPVAAKRSTAATARVDAAIIDRGPR